MAIEIQTVYPDFGRLKSRLFVGHHLKSGPFSPVWDLSEQSHDISKTRRRKVWFLDESRFQVSGIWILTISQGLEPNIGEAGSRLEVLRQSEYQSFVT